MKKLTLLLLSCMALPMALPMAAQAECKVSVVFTLNDQPAMQPVTSKIERNGLPVATFKRHSYAQVIPCGEGYKVTATLGDVSRSRRFTALTGTTRVVIAMDKGEGNK